MKKRNLILAAALMAVVFGVGSLSAQEMKMDMPMSKDSMKMGEMMRSPHHKLVMAYLHNALAFTHALWEMSSDGKIENIELARNAFAEVVRSLARVDEIQKMHMASMGKMDAAMMEKMKPMMAKMEAENAVVKMHVTMLERALNAPTPDANEIAMHTAFLLLKFEKTNMPEKMDMGGKM